MKIIQKAITSLEELDFNIAHLNIINFFLPVQLTPKEIEVLGAFMSLKGELVAKDRFGTTFRKEVKTSLKMSDGGLSNHLTSLKAKGAIKENLEGNLSIQEFLFPEENQQFYQFKIVKK
jgi:DNA-binding MarR family transcriptional regulator